MNNINQKILLVLSSAVAFSYAYQPDKKWKVLKDFPKEWNKIDKKKIRRSITDLCYFDFIDRVQDPKGLITLKLTEKGKLRVLKYKLANIKNKKQQWDGKWRMVAFDVPEKLRRGRDALRHTLRKVGFQELQKSIFVTPYDCLEEIEALIKFFNLGKYVRFGILNFIDNEDSFKKRFKLN